MSSGLHDGSAVLRWFGRPLGVAVLLLIFAAIIAVSPEVATAGAAAVALVGAVVTLSHADVTARRSRTAEYRRRWDAPELLEARIAAAEFLSLQGSSEEARWQLWVDWLEENLEVGRRLQVMSILNFWEEVAAAFNQDLLDDAWFRTDLAWLLEQNWTRAGWFIGKFRTEFRNAGYFCEWQIAVEAIRGDLERQKRDGQRALEAVGDGDPLAAPQRKPSR